MVEGVHEVMVIVGLGVICFVGSTILNKVGQPELSKLLDILGIVSGVFVILELFEDVKHEVERVFGVRF